ncbi:serine/threonine-protein phosphatase [Vibrio vulnificus]|uniref:PP2C family protein-serine/threonine phosphatase n=1 Tax=Vibrio vulnificus TaxID=672 RepID=UPI0012AD2811|nr:protein phosphatase 2C domain-containing protein [Vibrio vulnificus]EIF5019349.1 serine/threonine-protein phosphatase [Vibrio vulnificus]MCU8224113.1 protein phosphatase 2C domain-containing protein [Vibrio vulnificus]
MNSLQVLSTSSICLSKNLNDEGDDSILPPKKVGKGYLLAIADGVGKYDGAKIASQTAIDYLDNLEIVDDAIDFKHIFKKIKKRLEMIADESPELSKMATTLTACYVTKETITIGHTGDSRAYVMNNHKLQQLTSDQTEHEMLLSNGIFTKNQLKNHHRKSVLVSALSPRLELSIQEIEIKFESQIIYLMSDGAYNFWEDSPKFSNSTMETTTTFCASLGKRIKDKGPKDDFSIVGIQLRKLT